jgi:serine/tyrosine/threonine adenylyltransferase
MSALRWRGWSSLRFDNAFAASFPADARRDAQPRQTPRVAYAHATPTPTHAPAWLHLNDALAAAMGLPTQDDEDCSADLLRVLSGNAVAPGMMPIATRYAGHQFGNFAGQLGDGRAMTLGEQVHDGHPHGQRFEWQLKGAGPTAYSRQGDGRAVLRSSLREYVCSEAMHALGIPTTRALSLIATGERVMRDVMYDGHPAPEPGAVVCRVAPSFLRFGHLQMAAVENNTALLRQLLHHVVRLYMPDCRHDNDAETALAWWQEVANRSVRMVVGWQRVGFVHGVMNTDNCSVLGLSIDYGPYGFLEPVDWQWTPNTTDAGRRRYRYEQQPPIMMWNLVRLAEALLPLVEETHGEERAATLFEDALSTTSASMEQQLLQMWQQKLGLQGADGATHAFHKDDHAWLAEGFDLGQASAVDFTLWFRALADMAAFGAQRSVDAAYEHLAAISYEPARMASMRDRWQAWLHTLRAMWRRADGPTLSASARSERMNLVNPLYVPRNYLAQEAIDALMNGDVTRLHHWFDVLRQPYTEQAGAHAFAAMRPEWAAHRVGCSMLSCSS